LTQTIFQPQPQIGFHAQSVLLRHLHRRAPNAALLPTTDPQFNRLALENGILLHDSAMPPLSLVEIKLFLGQGRKSTDHGQTEFTTYEQQAETAPGEAGVKAALARLNR